MACGGRRRSIPRAPESENPTLGMLLFPFKGIAQSSDGRIAADAAEILNLSAGQDRIPLRLLGWRSSRDLRNTTGRSGGATNSLERNHPTGSWRGWARSCAVASDSLRTFPTWSTIKATIVRSILINPAPPVGPRRAFRRPQLSHGDLGESPESSEMLNGIGLATTGTTQAVGGRSDGRSPEGTNPVGS
jgi:hypothetical protein